MNTQPPGPRDNGVTVGELDRLIGALIAPVNELSQPQLSMLRMALREIEAIKLNIKMSGYALARDLADKIPPRKSPSAPTKFPLAWKPSTQADLQSEWAAHWLAELRIPLLFHRKLWELAYVPQVLWQTGKLKPGMRGVGFGCGTEPLPSLFASYGVEILATDMAPEASQDAGWSHSNQHTHSLEAIFHKRLVAREAFEKHVSLRFVDMRSIPDDMRDFDFCWSICALEHLGSIRAGLDFIKNSVATLKPGGVAVHTTEFNFLSDDVTLDNWPTVLYQRAHFEALARECEAAGHRVFPLNFDVGRDPLDLFVDVPPYPGDWTDYQKSVWLPSAHLKLSIDGFASTCFGIVVQARDAA